MKTKTGKQALSLILVSLYLCFGASTFAQKINLSGTWNYNEGKSQLGEGGRGRMAATKIKITQDDGKILLEKTSNSPTGEEFTSKETITLDGKECENIIMENRTKKSTANFSVDGKLLTISSLSVFERDGNKMEIKSIEIFKLSDDGNALAIDATSTSPRGERKQTLAYDKAK